MRIYDRDGKPLSLERWGELLRDQDYIRIAQDRGAGLLISTVWLGLDHAFGLGKNTPPLIFETMIFSETDGTSASHWPLGRGSTTARQEHEQGRSQYRYSTEAEARAGHERLVKRYLDPVSRIGQLDSMTPEEIARAEAAEDYDT